MLTYENRADTSINYYIILNAYIKPSLLSKGILPSIVSTPSSVGGCNFVVTQGYASFFPLPEIHF